VFSQKRLIPSLKKEFPQFNELHKRGRFTLTIIQYNIALGRYSGGRQHLKRLFYLFVQPESYPGLMIPPPPKGFLPAVQELVLFIQGLTYE
jgi:hypothetical protein